MGDNGIHMPIYYEHQNAIMSQVKPGTIHCHDNDLRRFFERYLIQRMVSVYKFTIPDTWAENYFLYNLFLRGYIAVVNTDKFGVICQHCGLYGYDVYYQPTHAIIANPLLRGNLRPRIGTQCTLIRLQPDYGGTYDLISYYADLLACASETLTTNLINSKFSYVFFADGKAQAETMKALFDKFSSGEPATVTDKNLLNEKGNPRWTLFTQNVAQQFIADKNLAVIRRIQQMFDTEIGIANANEDKKERMITDEVNANNFETYSKVSLWFSEIKKRCEQARKMFGININIEWRANDKSLFPQETQNDRDNTMGGDN